MLWTSRYFNFTLMFIYMPFVFIFYFYSVFIGSYGYEKQDAEQYAAWGVDYLKYDNCDHPANVSDSVRTQAMRDALNATGNTREESKGEGRKE